MTTDGPLLWYLNRSTGFVILALFTITTALGVLSLGSKAGKRMPSFVTQSVHRNIALLSMALLVAHAASAVVDTFVDIRWFSGTFGASAASSKSSGRIPTITCLPS